MRTAITAALLLAIGTAAKAPVKLTALAEHETVRVDIQNDRLTLADLEHGTVALLRGFSEERTGTKDSRRGKISRDRPHFVITYDIGAMSGLHMHPGKKDGCMWFREQSIGDRRCYLGMQKQGENKKLTISIVPKNGNDGKKPMAYPANFWATVTTEEQVVDLTLIAITYSAHVEKVESKDVQNSDTR